ncbi:MAG: sulfatase-like hydrolase/transferase [Bacteroidetes bacterium]|nr:sulfatase-like hydrolase/transferase [Bacteroidota bacterium]
MLLICSGISAQKNNPTNVKPNIIFILADDLGIGDVSAYGSDQNKTPFIDKLASEGIRFTHAYTASLCGPSRARILTGRYAFRTGAVNQDRVGQIKPAAEMITPTILKKAGYASALIGKWSQFGETPAAFGFDEYLTFKGSGVYWSTEKKGAETYFVNGKELPLPADVYMPDLMHQQVTKYISAHQKTPFFLHYSMVHVHANIQRTPFSKAGSDLYADNTAYMDKLVGDLVHVLDSLHMRENTVIIFMGDNGTASKYAERSSIGGKQLSGKKGTMLECGSLVPASISWPGKIKPGRISNQLIDACDFLPTLAELTGAPMPTDRVIDGKSFLPLLFNESASHRDWIFMELGNQWYVRDANWKLTREEKLFDMRNAPFEEIGVQKPDSLPATKAAFAKLKAVLTQLRPEAGFLDDGDGSGRHASNVKKGKKDADDQ